MHSSLSRRVALGAACFLLGCTPGVSEGAGGGGGSAVLCGDGERQSSESCDGDDLHDRTCADLGPNGRGTLACTSGCAFDLGDCAFGAVCGDGTAEGGESCDEGDLGGATDCTDAGYDTGALGCTSDCTYDFGDCAGGTPDDCGDGTRTGLEDCDGGTAGKTCQDIVGFNSGTLACDPDTCAWDVSGCTPGFFCGNREVEGSEACDVYAPAGVTCESSGFDGGVVACSDSCAVDLSGCTNGSDDFPNLHALYEATCTKTEQCAPEWGRRYASENLCLDAIEPLIELFAALWPDFEDRPEFAQCAAALAAMPCASIFDQSYLDNPACADLFPSFFGAAAEEGEECGFGGCVAGALCTDDDAGGPSCRRCVAAPGDTDPCIDGKCGEGLVCLGGLCTDPTGDPCLSDFDCGYDAFYCDPGSAAPDDQTCMLRGVGSPCEYLASDECGVDGLGCYADACITPRPGAGACDSADDCGGGQKCRSNGQCGAPLSRNAPCNGDECKGFLVCDGVCTDIPGFGEACDDTGPSSDNVCLLPGTCVAGECFDATVPPASLGLGDPCADAACLLDGPCELAFGMCVGTYCQDEGASPSYECEAFADVGAPCEDNDACDRATSYCADDPVDARDECFAYLAIDASCVEGLCNPELSYCDDTDTCASIGVEGDDCGRSSQCFGSLACYGLCEGGAYDGLPCDSTECGAGVCAGVCAVADFQHTQCGP